MCVTLLAVIVERVPHCYCNCKLCANRDRALEFRYNILLDVCTCTLQYQWICTCMCAYMCEWTCHSFTPIISSHHRSLSSLLSLLHSFHSITPITTFPPITPSLLSLPHTIIPITPSHHHSSHLTILKTLEKLLMR